MSKIKFEIFDLIYSFSQIRDIFKLNQYSDHLLA